MFTRKNRDSMGIPDAGPCPDRFASGVGVPPDENKRPAKRINNPSTVDLGDIFLGQKSLLN